MAGKVGVGGPVLVGRLLTKAQAAAYCGISVGRFSMLCPVRPLALGADKRLERYDVVALNQWIDSLGSTFLERETDWLAALDRKNGSGSR
jgi:hypothetical protein